MKTIDLKEMTQEQLREQAFRLLITDASGVYIPQRFSEENDPSAWSLSAGSWEWEQIKKDPTSEESEHLWGAWDTVCDKSERWIDGNAWSLYQSGDLWMINLTLIEDWMIEHEVDDLDDDFYPQG